MSRQVDRAARYRDSCTAIALERMEAAAAMGIKPAALVFAGCRYLAEHERQRIEAESVLEAYLLISESA